MKKNYFLIPALSIFLFSCAKNKSEPAPPNNTVVDADGNTYNTKKIGNQTWMLENLKTTKFNDGTPITKYSFATHGNKWFYIPAPEALYQWAWTGGSGTSLPFDFYGAMYNHFALESGKLAPKGWRIPTEQDFKELESYLRANGYANNEAIALKSTTGWDASSGNGTNAIGFNALPNGYVASGGSPTASLVIGSFATSTIGSGTLNSSTIRKTVNLFNVPTILFLDNSVALGFGVRCIKE